MLFSVVAATQTGTSAEIKVVSERLKAKVGQRIFLFNSEILDTFFADGQGGNCAFAATQSLNFTLNGAEYAYLDVSSGGNCEGSCSINVQINDVPNIQFIIAQCSNVPEKVDLAFRITSSDAVSCSTASYALSSLPWIVGVCAMVVLDVAMLGVTFLLYRRKVQLEELKI